MNSVFRETYADVYDLLYEGKDYPAECDLIERMLADYSRRRVRSILDLGCGTGAHAHILAQRGYQVLGIDRSEAMIRQARRKTDKTQTGCVDFHVDDIRTFQLDQRFDAAIMMFAVFGYLPENADLLSALAAVRKHLSEGSVFLFDFWYGPAVLHDKPGPRIRNIEFEDGSLTRTTTTELDIRRQRCTVNFHLHSVDAGGLSTEHDETHPMHFFFPRQVELLLECSGFSLLHLGAFPQWDHEPDETTFNVLAIARAV